MTHTLTPTRYNEVAKVPPPVGRPVIIWWWIGERVALWDGERWRDDNHRLLHGPVLYWREVQP